MKIIILVLGLIGCANTLQNSEDLGTIRIENGFDEAFQAYTYPNIFYIGWIAPGKTNCFWLPYNGENYKIILYGNSGEKYSTDVINPMYKHIVWVIPDNPKFTNKGCKAVIRYF